jgi:hypothetical protein
LNHILQYTHSQRSWTTLFTAFFAMVCLVLSPALPALSDAGSDYDKCVSSALDMIASGECSMSLSELTKAGVMDGGDPLYVTAMGFALLSGGRPADAMREFEAAIKLDKMRAEPVYGEGLIRLSEGKLAEATSCFVNCGLLDVKRQGRGGLEYARFLAGGKSLNAGVAGKDPTLMAIAALGMESSGLWGDGLKLWRSVLESAGRWKYRESGRVLMTFDATSPVRFTGVPVKSCKPSIASRLANLTVLSGVTTLNADVKKAAGVKAVSFFIDGRLVGLTNSKPFAYDWDTTSTPNGPHTLRIEGSNIDGSALTTKTVEVVVSNRNADARISSSQREQLYDRLWDMITLRPSVAAVNSHIAVCAGKTGEIGTQRNALIRCIAAAPTYPNAVSQLEQLVRTAGYAKASTAGSAAVVIDCGEAGLGKELGEALARSSGGFTVAVSGTLAESEASLLRRIVSSGHSVVSAGYGYQAVGMFPFDMAAVEVFRGISSVMDEGGDPDCVLLAGRDPGKWASKLATMGITVIMPTSGCSVGTLAACADKALKPGAVLVVSSSGLRPSDLSALKLMAELRGLTLAGVGKVVGGQ